MIPHSRPFLLPEDADAAAAVVRSGMLAGGAVAAALEDEWLRVTGMGAAACVGSGLGALRLALHALGVGPGDEVIVPAYSCVALLNAPLALGAQPVLADVEPDTWTIAPAAAEARLTDRTRAIVAVDLFGAPASLTGLEPLGHPIVEDCAHGVGGSSAAGPFGGAAAMSISSFYATKMIGAGEGGIVASRDPALVDAVRAARDYGDRAPSGTNLNDKLSEVEAALALAQLRRLPEILRRRAERAARYTAALTPLAESGRLVLPADLPGRIWYRYAVRIPGGDAAAICGRTAELGVRTEQPVWDLRGCAWWTDGLEQTATAFAEIVSLPLYPDLTETEQDLVVDAFGAALS